MKKYTRDELESLGYKIENAKIKSVDLSMEDHGCMVLLMGIEGDGWGFVYGGNVIGRGYLGATDFSGEKDSVPYIMRIMDTVGVCKFSRMEGKHIRVATKGWGESVKIIGNIIEDKWFDSESFFDDCKQEDNHER